MKDRTTQELDSLLGRGGIGASRRDAVLDAVLMRVGAEARPRPRWRRPIAAVGIVAAAAALLVLVPRLSPSDSSRFRAKGSAVPPGKPSVDIECVGASLGACPSGSLLAVRVAGVRGYVSAWAEPEGGGERIWYFSADTISPLVDAASAAPVTVPRAARIGPEHAAQTYVVEVRVTPRPLRREDLLLAPASAALASGRGRLTVTSP